MAFCPRCAAPNIDTAVACAACGAPISSSAPGAPGGMPSAPPSFDPGLQQGSVAPKMNGLAIAGFVCSFLCAIAGLPMSIVAYNQCKKSNGALKGEGLALAGIIISIAGFVLNIIFRVAMH
jgi:hypothetical protein